MGHQTWSPCQVKQLPWPILSVVLPVNHLHLQHCLLEEEFGHSIIFFAMENGSIRLLFVVYYSTTTFHLNCMIDSCRYVTLLQSTSVLTIQDLDQAHHPMLSYPSLSATHSLPSSDSMTIQPHLHMLTQQVSIRMAHPTMISM